MKPAYHKPAEAKRPTGGKRGGFGLDANLTPNPHTTHNLEAVLRGVC